MSTNGTAAVLAKKPSVYTPIHINSNYITMSAEKYGGKAHSLAQMTYYGFNVPSAWVIPCAKFKEKPYINLDQIMQLLLQGDKDPNDVLFAVRSGAPVSMPGLLETKLYVPIHEINARAQEVWDSWDSAHAIEYRNNNNISHDIGTAVIIQKMVENIKYAGVAFTNNPSNFYQKTKFSPIVEFVSGDGEKLVSGKKTPKRATGKEKFYKSLVQLLQTMHSSFNNCQGLDVEFAIDKDNKIHFLQMRPLKYSKPQLNTAGKENRTVLGQGLPVGSAVEGFGYLHDGLHSSKSVIMVNGFKTDNYTDLVKASAIIATQGGYTCHAAIVARELNKAAVSGVEWNGKTPQYGTPVLVDGVSGGIYSATEEEVESYSGPSFTPVQVKNRPNFNVSKNNWQASQLLYRFYEVVNLFQNGKIKENKKNELVQEIADVISSYLYLSTICETRHISALYNFKASQTSRAYKIALQLRKYGIKIPSKLDDKALARAAFYENGISAPKSVNRAIDVMRLVDEGFNSTDVAWKSSYGGKKWGSISTLLLQYLTGEITPAMFVDASFDLQHNGGTVFGKFSWMSAGDCLDSCLDYKVEGFDSLVSHLSSHGYLGSVSRLSVGKVDSLYGLMGQLTTPDEEEPELDPPATWEGDLNEEKQAAAYEAITISKEAIPCDCEKCKAEQNNSAEGAF